MEEREELRTELIGHKADHALWFQTRAVGLFGPAGGIMARQLLFWDTRGRDQEGWVYKSRKEMEAETGLSRRNQEKARKVLRGRGVLEEETRPVGHMRRQTMHYRLDLLKLVILLREQLDALNGPSEDKAYLLPEDEFPVDPYETPPF